MTEHNDRYAPPRTATHPVVDAGTPAPRRPFPWLLVARYAVGAYVLVTGLLGLWFLSQAWATLLDRAFIDPLSSPYRLLPGIVLKIATGIALLARRKLSLPLTLLWLASFLYLLWGIGFAHGISRDAFLNLGVLAALIAFQCHLLARGLLR